MSHRETNLPADEIASQPLLGEHFAADAIATPDAASAQSQADASSRGHSAADSGEETSSLQRFEDWIDAQLMILEEQQSRFVTDRSMLKSLRR